jgi:hypothetical protein
MQQRVIAAGALYTEAVALVTEFSGEILAGKRLVDKTHDYAGNVSEAIRVWRQRQVFELLPQTFTLFLIRQNMSTNWLQQLFHPETGPKINIQPKMKTTTLGQTTVLGRAFDSLHSFTKHIHGWRAKSQACSLRA